jgi:hypothetical protein
MITTFACVNAEFLLLLCFIGNLTTDFCVLLEFELRVSPHLGKHSTSLGTLPDKYCYLRADFIFPATHLDVTKVS